MSVLAEQIRSATQIIVSLSLLGGRDFLAVHGQTLVEALTPLIGHLTERGMLMLLPVLEVIIQVVPAEGPLLLQPALHALLRSLQGGQETSIVIAGKLLLESLSSIGAEGALLGLFRGE